MTCHCSKSPMRSYLACFVLSLAASARADPAVVAPACGEFLPMITDRWIGSPHRRVHFVPKVCNKIMVGGSLETIPPGIGVISGGVSADLTNTCIDKVCGRPLAPLTLYRAYVVKGKDTKLGLDFSTGGHTEDATHGHQVHRADPTRSLVGLVRTNENGLLNGGSRSLMIQSWFNRGHTGLTQFIQQTADKPGARTCSPTLAAIPDAFVEFLVFGINDTFRQGYTVPNVHVEGTVSNENPTGSVDVAIMVERTIGDVVKPPAGASHVSTFHKSVPEAWGTVSTTAVGAWGTEEGYVKATLMMAAPGGGCAVMRSGQIFTSPHHS